MACKEATTQIAVKAKKARRAIKVRREWGVGSKEWGW
jgi:hypothetical protein